MRLCFCGWFALLCGYAALADDHNHGSSPVTVEAPKIFLDKSQRIVAYQLARLDNARLLMVPRRTDDAKYVPVYSAIASRPGMAAQHREEAIKALVKLNDTSTTAAIFDALAGVEGDQRAVRRTQRELATIMLRQSTQTLLRDAPSLAEATTSSDPFTRSIGFAGLIVAGNSETALELAEADDASMLSLLQSLAIIPDAAVRNSLRKTVVAVLGSSESEAVKNAAIDALGFIDLYPDQTYGLVAPLVADDALREAAVKTLLKIDDADHDSKVSERLLGELVTYAEDTPTAARTSREFTDAMILADRLIAEVPTEAARDARERLGEVSVRMIRIKTVEEEMRYDTAYFAVEAGRPVQVVLENHDLMPHNFVLTIPGKLKEVAQLGLQVGPSGGETGLQYVPDSEMVLQATDMVPAHAEARLTFTAPSEPGEYPYVCTFPQHWYRMYGVMVVVEDLSAWLKNPTEPANPIGSNRTFVQSWTIDDFRGELEKGLVGRTPEIGKKIFVEASCGGCHKVAGEGGIIGPDLTDVITRWKGDRMGVLKEILDPSHKIDPKYTMQRVLTVDGRTLTGVLVGEDDDNVKLMPSAEAKQPIVIAQDDIEAMVPSSVSMMPKALMDQYTKDEVFELMNYLLQVAPHSGS